jgi:hypothetical protein
MDRGGFSQIKRDGVPVSIQACVFDGVSHGGQINAYAAQAFASNCLQELQRRSRQIVEGKQFEDSSSFWANMFVRLQNPRCNPGRHRSASKKIRPLFHVLGNMDAKYEAGGGCATAVSVAVNMHRGKGLPFSRCGSLSLMSGSSQANGSRRVLLLATPPLF